MNCGSNSVRTTSHLWHERECFGTLYCLATVALVIFLFIFGFKLINQLPLISRWTCWTVFRTFRLWRPPSHHIYDLYESCGGRGSYSFSASWSVGSTSGRKSSLLVQCGITRNLWFKVSLIIYYWIPRKVFCGLLFVGLFVVLYFLVLSTIGFRKKSFVAFYFLISLWFYIF